jgi:hypothetical protein
VANILNLAEARLNHANLISTMAKDPVLREQSKRSTLITRVEDLPF